MNEQFDNTIMNEPSKEIPITDPSWPQAIGDNVNTRLPYHADLLAAAPELLAALQTIIKLLDGKQPKDVPGALMVAQSAIKLIWPGRFCVSALRPKL